MSSEPVVPAPIRPPVQTSTGLETSRGAVSSWIGIVGPPALWFLDQQVNVVLVPWACGHAQPWVLHAVSAAFLVATLATAWLAWREHAAASRDVDGVATRRDRRRFMSLVGLLSSGLFSLVIIAQEIPNWLLDPCQR